MVRRSRLPISAISSELRVVAARPATRAVLAALVTFVIVPHFVSYWAATSITGWGPRTQRVAATLTIAEAPGLAVAMIGGMGGILALTLGALVVGSDYQWACAGARRLHTASRTAAARTRLCALALVLLVCAAITVLATLLLAAALPLPDLDLPSGLPPVRRVLGGIGLNWLVLAVWASWGVLLATALRSAEVALGVGALYALAAERVVQSTSHIGWMGMLQDASLSGLGLTAARLASSAAPAASMDAVDALVALAVMAALVPIAAIWVGARQDL